MPSSFPALYLPNVARTTLPTGGSPRRSAVAPADPAEYSRELPDPTLKSLMYSFSLFGALTPEHDYLLKDAATAIEADEVIASFRSSPFLETLRPGVAGGRRRWWMQWERHAEQKIIGEGANNSASLVTDPNNVPPEEMFRALYGMPAPANGVIIRRGTRKMKKTSVLKEISAACYAQAMGIGPIIYAQWYEVGRRTPNLGVPDQWDKPVVSVKSSGIFKAKVADPLGNSLQADATYTIAEAWAGDCKRIFGSLGAYQVPPDVFATEMFRLCDKAAAAGFWHMDIKRANMLYRTDRGRFELCFTDFDPFFCIVLDPSVRKDTRKCCIVATMAMFLGEMRCYLPMAASWAVARACRKVLDDNDVVLEEVTADDWCHFLRYTDELTKTVRVESAYGKRKKKEVALPVLRFEQKRLAERFQDHVMHYFQETDDRNDDCFQLDPSFPAFPQIVEYALQSL